MSLSIYPAFPLYVFVNKNMEIIKVDIIQLIYGSLIEDLLTMESSRNDSCFPTISLPEKWEKK